MSIPLELGLEEALVQRRAQRHFRPDPLPEGAIERIVGLANHTPSGFNICPIRIVCVTDADAKKRLRAACFNQAQIEEAPASLVVLSDHEAWKRWPEQRERLVGQGLLPAEVGDFMAKTVAGYFESLDEVERRVWAQRQAGLFSMSLMLATEAIGLNSCPMEGFLAPMVREAVEVDERYDVGLVLPIGYGTDEKTDWGRPELDEILFHDRLSH